ncbi:MAG: hypothetical protein Kow002_10620 [Anaerolineales bacterium]
MKRILTALVVLLFSQLACQAVLGTPVPTATPPPTDTPRPTATPQLTPEELNHGTHLYIRETIEAGCKATEDSKGVEQTEKTLTFSPDFSSVTYGKFTYQRTDSHRYQSKNTQDKPLVLLFYENGFDLEVYSKADVNTKTTDACLIFRFRFVD